MPSLDSENKRGYVFNLTAIASKGCRSNSRTGVVLASIRARAVSAGRVGPQKLPEQKSDAKPQQAHRPAPPDRRVVSGDLKLEKAADAAEQIQHCCDNQQRPNQLIHCFAPLSRVELTSPRGDRSILLPRDVGVNGAAEGEALTFAPQTGLEDQETTVSYEVGGAQARATI